MSAKDQKFKKLMAVQSKRLPTMCFQHNRKFLQSLENQYRFLGTKLKGTVMQIEKALINDRLLVTKVS